MLHFKPQSLLLLIPFLLLSSTLLFSHGVSHSQSHSLKTELTQEGHHGFQMRRSVVEEIFVAENLSFVLAAKRTYRRDPTNDFKRYTGGWNISERNYWASVGFTAAPLFVIALLWFALFGLCLLLISCHHCCCHHEPYGYSRTAYTLSLIFLILFTIAAIIGCIVLYIGQGKFHSSTTNTLEYVVKQANVTVDNLRNVSDYLDSAQKIGVARVFLAPDVQGRIDSIQTKINASSITLADRTKKNSDDIQDTLGTVRLFLIVVAAVMLLLAFLGFLLSVLGMQFLVYILVVVGWILVAGTFILCGVFLLLHNVVGDTCVAMDQWVKNPTAHTALDDILPCVDTATANETLLRSKEVTSQLVNVVNQVITNVSNINFAPSFAPLYYNQSGPLMPVLCNPFYSDMTDRKCETSEVNFDNATQVWHNYICQASPAGICMTTGRLTPDSYNQMAAAVNVSFGLHHYGPFLVQLEDCTFVRETFTEISRAHCPGLRKYSKWIYSGLVMVSAAVMLSLIFWVIYARERKHRVYNKFITRSGDLPPERKGP